LIFDKVNDEYGLQMCILQIVSSLDERKLQISLESF